MFKKKNFILAAALLTGQLLQAQEVSYIDRTLTGYQQKPAYPQYADYKTFDFAAVTTMDESEVNMNLPYKVKLGNFQQVPVSSDFHVVTLLRRMSGKFTTDKSLTANCFIETFLYDRFGTEVTSIYINKEDQVINFDAPMSKEERNNKDFVRQKVLEKVTEMLLAEFLGAYTGSKEDIAFELAELDDTKKFPELKDFPKISRQVKYSVNAADLLNALTPNVAVWEKLSSYSGPGDAGEVKRACFQNLAIYSILKGETDKAAGYIEQYKAVDKVHKQMMGLLKVKHSENCEKMLAKFNPVFETIDATAPTMTLQQIKDNFRYVSINGTITIEGKKNAGTYTGLIQVSKIVSSEGGGIAVLDAESADVLITTKDAAGKDQVITTELSKVVSLKDDKGNEYAIRKFGAATTAYYSLLKPTFQHEKITVYRAVIPVRFKDYVVKKKGDDTGVKSSMFNARKQLIDYLSDCAPLTEKLKSGAVDRNEKVEKIAEMYATCGAGGQ